VALMVVEAAKQTWSSLPDQLGNFALITTSQKVWQLMAIPAGSLSVSMKRHWFPVFIAMV